jgi:hypothetical protein
MCRPSTATHEIALFGRLKLQREGKRYKKASFRRLKQQTKCLCLRAGVRIDTHFLGGVFSNKAHISLHRRIITHYKTIMVYTLPK